MKTFGVTSVKGKNSNTIYKSSELKHYIYLEDCVYFEIHSVERLVDRENFSVGESIFIDNEHEETIIAFSLNLDNIDDLVVVMSDSSEYPLSYIGLSNKRKPILVTEDGYEIYDESELVWIFNKNFSDLRQVKAKVCIGFVGKGLKTYYKKKNAKEFILYNKPFLSINDLLNYLKSQNLEVNKVDPEFIKFVNKLKI